ncbi:MAG: hypothetical protein ABI304_05755 [Rudaea sp.]
MQSSRTLLMDAQRFPGDRIAGIAMLSASLLILLLLANHPNATASDLAGIVRELADQAWVDRFVHGSLMTLMGLLLFAYVEFSYWLGLQKRLVRLATIAYAIGICAMFAAALTDSFVLTAVAERYLEDSARDLEPFRALLRLCSFASQSLSTFGALAMSTGIGCWCVALWRKDGAGNSWLAVVGLLLGLLPSIVLLSGLFNLHGHEFLVVLVCQIAWNLLLGVQLLRHKV